MPDTQLHMLRPDLDDLPAPAWPDGYGCRSYGPGDAAHWERILTAAFAEDFPAGSFDRILRADPAFRPERVLFAVCGGVPVGTASAYRRVEFLPAGGMLHFVAVEPGHTGRRLGRAICGAALRRMRDEGRTCAWLSTDDPRLPAIRTYLGFGFEPLLIADDHRDRWRAVFDALADGDLPTRFARQLEGPLFRPPAPRRDICDYPERVHVRRRWHPARPCGRLHPDDLASRDDESLYRPTRLGRARVTPGEVGAGEDRPFTIEFEVGPAGIARGTAVRFWVAGQRPLGAGPQDRDPDAPAFVEIVDAPPDAEVETIGFGVKPTAADLRDGDRVRIDVGRVHGFRWTPLAGRKDLHVIVDPGHDEPKMRLPEPAVIRVMPAEPAAVEVFGPMSTSSAAPVRVVVRVRDRFDNRVDWHGPAEVRADDGPAVTAFVSGGLGAATMPPPAGRPFRIRARLDDPAVEPGEHVCVRIGGGEMPEGLGLYVGDMHVHDVTCEAEGTAVDAYRWAIEEKRLDFMALAVQCHNWIDPDKWHIIKYFAEAFLDEGRFVTFPSFEWQHSAYGDKVVHYLGGDMPYLPVEDPRYRTPAGLYEALRGADAFVISHHPGYELDQWVPGTDFGAVEADVDCCVELWSMHGSSEGRDPADRPLRGERRESPVIDALRAGVRMGFVAGSDTHVARPGGGAKEPVGYPGGLCAVWARDLTRRGLAEAFRARRTCALTGARIATWMTVNGAPMGAATAAAARYRIRIAASAPGEIERVEILRAGEVIATRSVNAADAVVEIDDARVPDTETALFYHARVVTRSGDLAVTSPVFVDVPRGPGDL